PAVNCFYLDIFSTQNLHDFVTLFGNMVLGQLDPFSTTIMNKMMAFFKNCRPSFSYDSMTDSPKLLLEIDAAHLENSLQEIFQYLQESGKTCFIAMDEFQQITTWPEKGVETLLCSYIQSLPNVHFIFSGSKKHLMDAIFTSVNRPFYQSTQEIVLGAIPCEVYQQFAIQLFSDAGKILTESMFHYIYDTMLGHTWYIQLILNQLYALPKKEYSEEDLFHILNAMLQEENATYKTYCEMITKGQLRLLIAIAKEKKVASPFENSFMKKYDLTAVSSVKLALNSLVDKTLLLQDENGGYFVYDRFFSLWLEKNKGGVR
ncbi:MAG: ATP-binding protein, partial [Bacteroidales bacterium]